jgi:hypothetical protein
VTTLLTLAGFKVELSDEIQLSYFFKYAWHTQTFGLGFYPVIFGCIGFAGFQAGFHPVFDFRGETITYFLINILEKAVSG